MRRWVFSAKNIAATYVSRSTTEMPTEAVSMSDPNSTICSPGSGRPVPCASAMSVGRSSAATASSSIPEYACTAVRSNVCFSRRQPPTSIEAPRTRRTFPITEPTSDAFTTSWSPSMREKNARINSGPLPNVTLRMPPTPGPAFSASSSVARVIMNAAGISAKDAKPKTTRGGACRNSSATATGMAANMA
jgi:hypothetical protein